MLKLNHALVFGLLISGSTTALADSDGHKAKNVTCPDIVVTNANKSFGIDSGDKTTCISVREDLKIVVAINDKETNPRNGKGQQLLNVSNIFSDYVGNYGMKPGEDFEIVVVGYGAGARWLLNDSAYSSNFSSENPSDDMVTSLMAKGVKFYMCQNTMKGNGWVSNDLIPGVQMVPAGVTAVIDLQNRHYTYITP